MKNFYKKNKNIIDRTSFLIVSILVIFLAFIIPQKLEEAKFKDFVFKSEDIVFTIAENDMFYVEFDEFNVGKYLSENGKLILVKTIRGTPLEEIPFDKENKTINDKEYKSIVKFDKERKIDNLFNFSIIGLTKDELQSLNTKFDFLQDFALETPNGPKFGSRLVGEDGTDYFVVFYSDGKVDSVSLNLSISKDKEFIEFVLKNKLLNKENELLIDKNSTSSNIFYFEDGTISITKEDYNSDYVSYEIRKYNSSNIGFKHNFLTDYEFLMSN